MPCARRSSSRLPAEDLETAPLAPAGLREAARLLGRAFRDNPLNVAVLGGRSPHGRERANVAGMRALLPTALAHGEVWVAREGGVLRAVLVATPPFGHPLPAPSLPAQLRAVWVQGPAAAGRWREVFERLTALHPREPHSTLGVLGVDPGHQGRGIGGALLERWLAVREAAGVGRGSGVYLETDREENLRFYARRGFARAGELELFGARVWRLWREPRGVPSGR